MVIGWLAMSAGAQEQERPPPPPPEIVIRSPEPKPDPKAERKRKKQEERDRKRQEAQQREEAQQRQRAQQEQKGATAQPAPAQGSQPAGEIRNGVSFGLSIGLATGVGPTFGIPLGQKARVQITTLPMAFPDVGGGGSVGLRLQQFLGRNPRSRLYLVEGAAIHGWNNAGSLWGAAIGMGVETRKDASSGRTLWADLSLTVFGTNEGPIALLPLPQAGVAWEF